MYLLIVIKRKTWNVGFHRCDLNSAVRLRAMMYLMRRYNGVAALFAFGDIDRVVIIYESLIAAAAFFALLPYRCLYDANSAVL